MKQVGMTDIDAGIIEQYADHLYRKAAARVTCYTIGGALLGAVAGAVASGLLHVTSQPLIPSHLGYATLLVGAAALGFYGYRLGVPARLRAAATGAAGPAPAPGRAHDSAPRRRGRRGRRGPARRGTGSAGGCAARRPRPCPPLSRSRLRRPLRLRPLRLRRPLSSRSRPLRR